MTTAITTAGEELWRLFSQSQRPLNKEIVPVTTISLASGVVIAHGRQRRLRVRAKARVACPGAGAGAGAGVRLQKVFIKIKEVMWF